MKVVNEPIGQPARCLNCEEPLETPIGCLHCHSIFPDQKSLTHYDRLGLPMRYELSREEIDRKYLAWSRELHPDFHATRGTTDQQISLKLSAALNDAYATLRDPAKRAEYLLHLLGGASPNTHRGMPRGFLESILDLRMEIEEAQEQGTEGEQEFEAIADRLEQERTATLAEIGDCFRQLESRSGKATSGELAQIRELLNTVKYRDGLLRELSRS
jgi:molecular chaperone HscB